VTQELGTTNLLLGIMAGVSVFEALAIVGILIAGLSAYRKAMASVDQALLLANGMQVRLAETMLRVNAILDDVKGVTAKVKQETLRVDHAIHSTIDRIDHTADRLRTNVRSKTSGLFGFISGARAVLEEVLR
jgi:hypothetical protein